MLNMTKNEYRGEKYDIKIDEKLRISDEKNLEFSKVCKKNYLPEDIRIEETFEDLQGIDEDLKNLNCFGENHAIKIDEKLRISDEKDLEFSKKLFT